MHRAHAESSSRLLPLMPSMCDRVPEECPQEIADLIASCTGDAAERPDAQECAHFIAQFVPSAATRRSTSHSLSGHSSRPLLKASGRAASGENTKSGAANSAAGGSVRGGTPPAAATPEAELHREDTDKSCSAEAAPEAQVVRDSTANLEGGARQREATTVQATLTAQEAAGANR